MLQFFPGTRVDDLPDGEGWAIERIQLVHPQRHPSRRPLPLRVHHGQRPTRAITIDEVPLDWCFRRGVKLDFRHFGDGYVVTADDIDAELDRIGHTLPRSTSSWSTRARVPATATTTMWTPAAAWAMMRRCTCCARACG